MKTEYIRKLESVGDLDLLNYGSLIDTKMDNLCKKLIFLKYLGDVKRYFFVGRGQDKQIEFYGLRRDNLKIRKGNLITNIKRKINVTFSINNQDYDNIKHLMEYIGI